jgi:hypothetical protein
LPFILAPQLTPTTLLYAKEALTYGSGSAFSLPSGAPALNTDRKHYFSGRSDNFDPAQPSSSPTDARLDPEGIRAAPDGVHVYISDEYGPCVYEFERTTGKRTRSVSLPADLAIAKLSASGADEIADNSSGRVSNKGMEGLAITPDGRSVVGAMQSPLIQDGGTDGSVTRIVSIELDTGAIKQFAYPLTNIGSADKPKYPAVSEILALDDHQFLVDERDSKGLGDDSEAGFKTIYRIDLRGAADVSGLAGEAALKAKAVAKTPFLDIVASLRAHGLAAADIPAKSKAWPLGPTCGSTGRASAPCSCRPTTTSSRPSPTLTTRTGSTIRISSSCSRSSPTQCRARRRNPMRTRGRRRPRRSSAPRVAHRPDSQIWRADDTS